MPTPQENKLENVGNFQSHIATTVLATVTGEVALSARSIESKYSFRLISMGGHSVSQSVGILWNLKNPILYILFYKVTNKYISGIYQWVRRRCRTLSTRF